MPATDRQSSREKTASGGEIKILHVDDEDLMRTTTATMLEHENDLMVVTSEPDAQRALERLDTADFDCIVSDYRMPTMDGIEFLEAVRTRQLDIPFIIFTGQGSEDVASEAISAGVTDYLQKRGGDEEFAVLARQIVNVVERDRAIERFESFLESAPDGIVVVDPSGEIKQLNEHLTRLFGYDRSALLGEPVEVLLPERFRAQHREYRDEYVADPQTRTMGAELDLFALHSDGTEFPVDISISPIEVGERIEIMAAVRDISTRIWHERQFHEEQALTEGIFTALPDAVYVIETDGSVIRWNDRLEAVTGYRPAELDEMRALDLFPDHEQQCCTETIDRVLAGDGPERLESTLLTKTGDHVPFEFTAGIIRDTNGTVLGVTGTCRDLTEMKAQEERLQRQVERLDEFASVVSHDLRNPLTVARAHHQLLREEVESDSLAPLGDALERMTELIDSLLTLAQEGDVVSELEPVSTTTIAERAWGTVETEDAALVIVDDVSLDADPERLRVLFENLFRNAVEHAGDETRIEVGSVDGGFYVADDGPGIPPEERERVVELGYTLSADGNGFGLAIVEDIVTAHDWTIHVTESATGGARFDIAVQGRRDDR